MTISIVNLDCATCAQTIERALRAEPGVDQATINFARSVAFVTYDPQVTHLEALTAAIKGVGYRVGGAKAPIGIKNLHCASCVRFIEEALMATPGVIKATVSVGTQEASVEYLPEMIDLPGCGRPSARSWYWSRPIRSLPPSCVTCR